MSLDETCVLSVRVRARAHVNLSNDEEGTHHYQQALAQKGSSTRQRLCCVSCTNLAQ